MAERDLVRFTVDCIIETPRGLVLIKRKNWPFQDRWCLPGGHVDANETAEQALERETLEETGIRIKAEHSQLVGVYSEPDRDPKKPRSISACYYARTEQNPRAGSDAEQVKQFTWEKIPKKLGFDHAQMLKDAKRMVLNKTEK